MYSLVNAAVLGFDLVRLPDGAAVARVLLEALALRPSDVDAVGRYYVDDPERDDAWLTVMRAAGGMQRMGAAIDDAGALLSSGRLRQESVATVVDVLARAPLGNLDSLLRLLRGEILGPPVADGVGANVAALACDAAAAAYVAPALPVDQRRRLTAPWQRAMRRVHAPPVDVGVAATVLARAAALRQPDCAALTEALDGSRKAGVPWPELMHQATAAIVVAGTERNAAAAQLRGVVALHGAGVPLPVVARGVWTALSGCLQGVLADDPSGDAFAALRAPWERMTSGVGPAA